ncbi:MAG: RNA ligase family protein [Candidatus Ozemobacteraceae bacterium]
MSVDFFRFPQTPHILWLGPGTPRDDKVMTTEDARTFLNGEILVEEKVDGANVGFSVNEQGDLQIQNRGTILSPIHCHGQFKPLFRWLEPHRDDLQDALFPDLMLFGEWCYAVHSIRYDHLPDWFLVFDVYDRSNQCFWCSRKRDDLVGHLGLSLVPRVNCGRYYLEDLPKLLGASQVTNGTVEGVYFRRDHGECLSARAKLVRPAFVQAIEEHWSRRAMRINQRTGCQSWP